MNLFQIVLVVFSTLIVVVWIYMITETIKDIQKLKKEDKRANKDIKKENYIIDLYTQLKNEEKIYMTSNGTVLNSEPHTFEDFINNQKLPSKLELVWEILGDNNIRVSDIINRIENNAPYPMDARVGLAMDSLKITPTQKKIMNVIKMYNQLINIDDKYPLYIEFTDMKNYYDEYITVIYKAGYGDGEKYIDRRHLPTKPTKY